MRFRVDYTLAFLIGTYGCASVSDANSVHDARRAINACEEQVSRSIGAAVLDAADHVYVITTVGGYQVTLFHGEMGTFGPRTIGAGPVANCTVQAQSMEVVVLTDAEFNAVLGDPELDYGLASGPEDEIVQSLFLRQDGELEFCCSQTLAEAEAHLDQYNPRPLEPCRGECTITIP